jgi:three-Cys-motif partner protein
MPARDLHDKPYDEGTKTKLTIYRSYVQAWLQVFLHAAAYRGKPLQFFDFFAGPGEDALHVAGSPLILIEELLAQRLHLENGNHEIRIFFNDRDSEKIRNLKRLCAQRSLPWIPRFESLEFASAFVKAKDDFKAAPSLVFVDQNGLKHVTREVFNAFTEAVTTDFIFFTASSYKHRFGDLLAPEIKMPSDTSYLEVHRVLADVYRSWAPAGVFIGHFSIRKDPNIYGLIFGSHHWRGMQKFLDIAWKLDSTCGEADYEIEQDIGQGLIDFERGTTGFKKRKVELFQEALSSEIVAGVHKSDGDVFLHCLTNGFRPRAAKEVYAKLRNDGFLKNARDQFPRYSAEAMKQPRKLLL